MDQVLTQCRAYWSESGVSSTAIDEMTAELGAHLQDAIDNDKSIETVTGPNIEEFAKEWAFASQGPNPDTGTSGARSKAMPRTDSRSPGWALWAGILVMVALVVLVAVLAPKTETDDQAAWITVWFIGAAVLAVGELLTAGFFLLPFAVGAGAAGVLALIGVAPPIQIITFLVISIASLWWLQQFAKKDRHGELIPVGAARYVGASALVTETVSRRQVGWATMGTEVWRATTDEEGEIPPGTEVDVVEVRGARLVLARIKK